MILSSEQMRAVEAGLPGRATFEWVDVPVGPQPLPPWAKGLEIRWMDGYANPPCYTVKTDRWLSKWPDQVYRKEGDRYLSESGDGRARCYYAHGEPVITELKQKLICYPVTPRDDADEYRYDKSGRWHCCQLKPSGKIWWSPYLAWATPQGGGYGGDNIPIKLDDGRWVMLRGPWHGPEPEGYIDVAGRGTSFGASGAGAISHEALILLIARYRPECRVARVTIRGRTSIEAVRPDWDEPKSIMLERGRI